MPNFNRIREFPFMLLSSIMLLLAASGEPSDLEKLQGKWVLAAIQIHDRKESNVLVDDFSKNSVLTISGNNGIIKKGDVVIYDFTITLEPTKNPKWYNSTGKNGIMRQGIYKIKNNKLYLCISSEGKPRPTEFMPKVDEYLSQYIRLKDH